MGRRCPHTGEVTVHAVQSKNEALFVVDGLLSADLIVTDVVPTEPQYRLECEDCGVTFGPTTYRTGVPRWVHHAIQAVHRSRTEVLDAPATGGGR